MGARINHLAICSENVAREGKFYEAAFGMRVPGWEEGRRATPSQRGGLALGDGYLGLTVFSRKQGYIPGVHHFGVDVDDSEATGARIVEKYPSLKVLKRPSNRPFSSFGGHDPCGNYFDISQPTLENRAGLYVQKEVREQERQVSHIKLRVVDAPGVARFYQEIFEFEEMKKALEDPNFYLTDGRVTLVIAPWNLLDYEGAGIEKPGIEHIGFRVESLDAVKEDLAELRKSDSDLAEKPVVNPSEGEVRRSLIASCRHGNYVTSDPDGVFIDISEA